MDISKVFKNKSYNISDSSIKLYIKNLERLNNNNPITNLKFLDKPSEVMNKISNKAQSTQRSYIISIVSLLKEFQTKKYIKLYDSYYKILTDFNNKLKDNTEKTDKEKENWITPEQIKEVYDKLYNEVMEEIQGKKKITETVFTKLLHLMVLSLYHLQSPRRNEYQNMDVVKTDENLDETKNYLNLATKQFIFNQYKTKGKYNQQIIKIDNDLLNIIKIYLNFHPLKKENQYPFLVKSNGEPLTLINDITRILNKVFGQKIGSSMLRKMFYTNKYGPVIEEIKKDAINDAHSVDVILDNYIKK